MMSEIEKAADVLKKGGLVVYPTDTLYALGASIYNESAVRKVYRIKKRPLDFHLPVAVGSIKQIENVAVINATAKRIAERFMPGAVTLVMRKREDISDVVAGEKIAVRVPSNKTALRIISLAGEITATSANLHGQSAPSTVEDAKKQLGSSVDMYVDGGNLLGIPSTIVDVSGSSIKIIREGAISAEELNE